MPELGGVGTRRIEHASCAGQLHEPRTTARLDRPARCGRMQVFAGWKNVFWTGHQYSPERTSCVSFSTSATVEMAPLSRPSILPKPAAPFGPTVSVPVVAEGLSLP